MPSLFAAFFSSSSLSSLELSSDQVTSSSPNSFSSLPSPDALASIIVWYAVQYASRSNSSVHFFLLLILPLVIVTAVGSTHAIMFAMNVALYRLLSAVSPHYYVCSLYSINPFSSSSVTGLNHCSVSTSIEIYASSCPRGTSTTLYRTLLNVLSLSFSCRATRLTACPFFVRALGAAAALRLYPFSVLPDTYHPRRQANSRFLIAFPNHVLALARFFACNGSLPFSNFKLAVSPTFIFYFHLFSVLEISGRQGRAVGNAGIQR